MPGGPRPCRPWRPCHDPPHPAPRRALRRDCRAACGERDRTRRWPAVASPGGTGRRAPIRPRPEPDRASRPGTARALHGGVGAEGGAARTRGRQFRGVGLSAEGPARLPPVVRHAGLRRADPGRESRRRRGRAAGGERRAVRARGVHRRRGVARAARRPGRHHPARRHDVAAAAGGGEVPAGPEADVAGGARRPVQLLGRGPEGVRARGGQRQARGDDRVAVRDRSARAAGPQSARRAVAVHHRDYARDRRARSRPDCHLGEPRRARGREGDLPEAARVERGDVPRVGGALPAASRGDDEHRQPGRSPRSRVRVGQGRARQGVCLQPPPRVRAPRWPGAVGHERAAGVRLVLWRRRVHQLVGDDGLRRLRHGEADARVPARAAARRRQDDARAVAGRGVPQVVRGVPVRLLPCRHDAALHHRGARLRASERRRS